MRNLKPILLIEDDKIHAMTVKRALNDLKVTNELIHKVNGAEALEYLNNESNRIPCVILLDLNMPKMNGIEFLKIAKADEQLMQIPIIVLTTSKNEQDILESFKKSVAGYIVKPMSYTDFVEKIRVLDLYWSISELPKGD